jgi:SAM-dependent methyltransferase
MGEEFDIGYFDRTVKRALRRGQRTIRQRMIAFGLGKEYYDGARENGYGGFSYDGRWKRLLPHVIERYGLSGQSRILDVGCKKGFLMHDLKAMLPLALVRGVESHPYPIETAMPDIREAIAQAPYDHLPFPDASFDFVIGFSSIYMLNLEGVMGALREIERVGTGKSFVTLGAYRTEEERELFQAWTLLGTTILHVDEWREVFAYTGYRGDYFFTTASSLNLYWAE